jgi:hypothetical protein
MLSVKLIKMDYLHILTHIYTYIHVYTWIQMNLNIYIYIYIYIYIPVILTNAISKAASNAGLFASVIVIPVKNVRTGCLV